MIVIPHCYVMIEQYDCTLGDINLKDIVVRFRYRLLKRFITFLFFTFRASFSIFHHVPFPVDYNMLLELLILFPAAIKLFTGAANIANAALNYA